MSKNFPALASAVAQTVLTVLIGLGLFHLSSGIAGAIEAFVAAGAGLWVATRVHEGFVPAATGLVNAGVVLLVAFKTPHITVADVSKIDAVLMATLALVTHSLSTPKVKPAPIRRSPQPRQ